MIRYHLTNQPNPNYAKSDNATVAYCIGEVIDGELYFIYGVHELQLPKEHLEILITIINDNSRTTTRPS